jgi:hypothetical protein
MTEAAILISVNFSTVPDNAHNDLAGLAIDEVQHPIIANTDTPTITIAKLLTTIGKRINFQSQDCLGDAGLNLSGQSRKFLTGGSRDLDVPILRHQDFKP